MATIKVKGRFEQNVFSCVKLSSKIYVKKKCLELERGGKFKGKLMKWILDFEILNKCITY